MNVAQQAVKKGMFMSGVLANASIKASVAYQKTPGYLLKDVITERVIIYRNGSLPGGFPSRPCCEVSTQTEEMQQKIKKRKSLGDLMYSITESAHTYGVSYLKGKESAPTDETQIPPEHKANLGKVMSPSHHPVKKFYEDGMVESQPSQPVEVAECDSTATSEFIQKVSINAGGYSYMTTIQTVTTFSDSYLARYFRFITLGNVEADMDWYHGLSEILYVNGNKHFLDVDGLAFYYILTYLRLHSTRKDNSPPPNRALHGIEDFFVLESIIDISKLLKLDQLHGDAFRQLVHLKARRSAGVLYEILVTVVALLQLIVQEFCIYWNIQIDREQVYNRIDSTFRAFMDSSLPAWIGTSVVVFVIACIIAM